MKKIFLIFVLVLLITLTSCSQTLPEENPNQESYFTISFIQEGQDTIKRTVKKNEALTDVPSPVSIDGYDVYWTITDFTNIQSNITVNAIITPKIYTIYYDLTGFNDAYIPSSTQQVQYNSEYTLTVPTWKDLKYDFLYWVVKDTNTKFTDGTYQLTYDLTLTPVWDNKVTNTPNY